MVKKERMDLSMENIEIITALLNQIETENEIIKNMSDNMTKLSENYVIKDKEKDKRHAITNLIIILLSLLTLSFFIGSYFWSDYPVSTVNGNNNSTISGNNNSNNKLGGVN